MFDGKAFGQQIVAEVKTFLEREISGVVSRIEAIEKRLDALPAPRDGKDADLGAVRSMIGEELSGLKAAIDAIGPAPELPDLAAMVKEAVAERVAALPPAKDGASVTADDLRPLVEAEVRARVAEIPAPKDGRDGIDGKDGASFTVDDFRPLVEAEVRSRVAELPVPKDGRDGIDGKDGVGLAGAVIDRDGGLIVTLTNGETKNLGAVVGRDGAPGLPGKDGRDGFNLEDFDAELSKDGRTVLLSFDRGDLSYKIELGFPAMIYRGVFKEGESYERGDTVTWAGSLWHCDENTSDKPGDGKSWTLAVKRGRDGKDGKDGGPTTPPPPVKLR
ncbi:hypothetical protein [Sinorhizobium fredii]|uniref:hypothetical protein n=1 Tax=Rhizobium fredii TaxID=380 RepID=UPI0004AE3862|nr:hypothetical protein [Sinorhizobium fredii]ASY68887.1 Phage portal protein [Sinorhizobium fredii CCBAU 83666]